jgi:hypothetical protein|tara:strand:- start:840 stop:1577 length:738 start_codon:yes stop_codon:yes gene_type:complete
MRQNENGNPINATKRARVRGNRGPRRHQVKRLVEIFDVPNNVIEDIKTVSRDHAIDHLGTEDYQVSKYCDLTDTFHRLKKTIGKQWPYNVNDDLFDKSTTNYKQVLLQKCNIYDNPLEEVEETNYFNWDIEKPINNIKTWLEDNFANVYRSRIAICPPEHYLEWHIDTDTSAIGRIQICAEHGDAKIEWKTKQGVEQYKMENNKCYFFNTGWPHRIINGPAQRTVLLAGVYIDEMSDDLKQKILI